MKDFFQMLLSITENVIINETCFASKPIKMVIIHLCMFLKYRKIYFGKLLLLFFDKRESFILDSAKGLSIVSIPKIVFYELCYRTRDVNIPILFSMKISLFLWNDIHRTNESIQTFLKMPEDIRVNLFTLMI